MGILDQADWSGVDESQQGDFTPVPAGEYTIEGVSFEEKTYNSGNQGIDIQFKIVGPTHENATVEAVMNRPLQANIGIEESNNGYPPKNRIKSFLAPNAPAQQPDQQQGAQPQSAAPPPQQAAPQAQQPTGQQVNWS